MRDQEGEELSELITVVCSLLAVGGIVLFAKLTLTRPKRKEDRWFEVDSAQVTHAHRKAKEKKR